VSLAELQAIEAAHVVPSYARMPVELVRGAGTRLWDADGNEYLDFLAGISVLNVGHCHPAVVAAVREQVGTLTHVTNLFYTEPAMRLAQRLAKSSLGGKVFFCNSGAEANEGAFKFARRWARTLGEAKHEIIALRGSFHGRLFGTLAATDRPGYRLPFRPLAPGISIFERDLKELDAALNADTVAALIVEPIQGEGGVRVIDHGFLRELRAVTKARNIALVFDEIQCGLGRTGTLFAYEQVGVVPDMLTLAKPLAGGLPMGAVLMTEPIAAAMQYGDHGTTFGGGPFVATVALHVLERLADPALLAHVRETGAWFGRELNEIAHRTSRIRQVRGAGFMWGIDVMGTAAHVVSEAMAHGLLVLTAGEYTVRVLPPLVATKEELARGLHILEEIL
jgi:acetylornithine/N-succinyldiaminopimelate aminotransferase